MTVGVNEIKNNLETIPLKIDKELKNSCGCGCAGAK
jgi:translation initiation factor 1 (eIF-1/SUI1)